MVACYALRGASGFGAAAAMPLMALVIPLKVLIPAWTLIGLCAGFTLIGRDRAHIAWRDIARLLPACLAGIAIGLYVFTALDSRTLAQGLGVLIVLYGVYSLWLSYRPPPRWQGAQGVMAPVAGVLGGAVGTTFGTMASVFFAIYFDVIRMAKDQFRASMTAILVALGIVRGLGYWAVGEYTRDVLITVAIALPMMLAGIFIGNRIHTGLSEPAFRRLISGALMVSGLALLAKSW
jgi:uncharacterized membrane protein YfcA